MTYLRYFDLHSHVSFKHYDEDRAEVLARMEADGVGTITVGVDLATSIGAADFANKHENFYATIGLHPNDTPTETFEPRLYDPILHNAKVVGIGECGLDYFRLPAQAGIEGDVEAEKKRQWHEFEKQMAFAIEHDLPLMIHCRPSKGSVDAYEEMAARLEEEHKRVGEKLRGNMHFFVGNIDVARRFYQIGFTTSYTGVLTFARDYDEVVRFAPLDMLLTETDAPYATPAPHRGKRNEPSYVKYVVEALAGIRGEDSERVRVQVLENAKRLFKL